MLKNWIGIIVSVPISSMYIVTWVLFLSAAAMAQATADDGHSTARTPSRESMLEIIARIETDYVDEISIDSPDIERFLEMDINDVLAELGLSHQTRYFPPSAYRQPPVRTGRAGIILTRQGDDVLVLEVLERGPADRAGLRRGDHVFAIDGVPVSQIVYSDLSTKLTGSVDQPGEISVSSGGGPVVELALLRSPIDFPDINFSVFGDVGHLRIRRFGEHTLEHVQSALIDAGSRAESPITGLVLDLRGNPGGLLDQAVSIAGLFLDGNIVGSVRGRLGSPAEPLRAQRGEALPGVEMVVLIDGGSAAGTELIAAALQEDGRATVVGMRSFGSAAMSTLIPLRGARDGALLLPTHRLYSPAGIPIDGQGVTPDVFVQLADGPDNPLPARPEPIGGTDGGETDSPEDPQLSVAIAILRAH